MSSAAPQPGAFECRHGCKRAERVLTIGLPADRATELDITMIGLHNAGKTSLLRVLAVCHIIPFMHLVANVVGAGRGVHHRVSHGLCSLMLAINLLRLTRRLDM